MSHTAKYLRACELYEHEVSLCERPDDKSIVDGFAEIVLSGTQVLEDYDFINRLAKELRVARSTVLRWAGGTAVPGINVRKLVVDVICRLAEEANAKYISSNSAP
jgi:hypothetical protein